MSHLDRRSLLEYSLLGAGLGLVGGPASAAGDAGAGGFTGNPYANDGAEPWIVDETSAMADTDSGKVVGYVQGGVRVFQGIPYAEILSQEGRWARGAKVRPWTGVRSSRAQGPDCPQADAPVGLVGVNGSDKDEAKLRDSDLLPLHPGENCLRVNIWTPGADNKKRPVLFYCHGGGFSDGGAISARTYEGHRLAKYGDVVVVSVAHRLNALGFLDLTAYGARYADSANVGMLDIVDALKWVRTNIANFGGDPGNVTTFGHSGGGTKVLALYCMPEAKGLFHRGVAMSPGGEIPFPTPAQSAARTASYLKLLGVSPSNIGALHKLPAETLMGAAVAIRGVAMPLREHVDQVANTNDWAPKVDGRAVVYDPTKPTMVSDVPLIVGTALHEFYNLLDHPEQATMKEPQARAILRNFYGPAGNDIYDTYKKNFPKADPFELSAITRATGRQRVYAVKIAQRRAALNSAPTYNYWVQWRSNNFGGRAMSYHGIEMPLVFLNSDQVPNITGGTAEARALSLKMAESLLAFARTGNPNTKALPNWSPVTPNAVSCMVFDNSCRIDHGSDLAAVELAWKSRYPNG